MSDKCHDLTLTLYALAEYFRFCPNCYVSMKGSNCSRCNEYYCECICEPLTPDQIRKGEIHNSQKESDHD